METRSPSIACIGVIGRHNNPLHISLFPATGSGYEEKRNELSFSFMLNSCLDIFEARMPSKTIGHDFGLLHALDERIAMYGWLTNTGVKLVIVVDMEGRPAVSAEAGKTAILGLRNSDLTPAFQALQTAYIRLLRNPFYVPDDHDPKLVKGAGSLHITSPRFIKEVKRIGKAWSPVTAMRLPSNNYQDSRTPPDRDNIREPPSQSGRNSHRINHKTFEQKLTTGLLSQARVDLGAVQDTAVRTVVEAVKLLAMSSDLTSMKQGVV